MYMRLNSNVGGRRRRQLSLDDVEVTEAYTDLTKDALFDFTCVAFESAPAADIDWSIELANGGTSAVTQSLNGVTVTTENASGAVDGLLNTYSKISFSATSDILGAKVKCCAQHVAIPGGTDTGKGSDYDEDPRLQLLCKETILRFPRRCHMLSFPLPLLQYTFTGVSC